jgi:hypothetical protein
LRAGHGLPLRNNYGRTVNGIRIVDFDFYDKDTDNDFVSKPLTKKGVIVGVPQTEEEKHEFSNELRRRKVSDSEKIFQERLASVDIGKLTIDGLRYEPFEPIETSDHRFSAMFKPHDESGNIKIIGRWSTNPASFGIPHVDARGSSATFDRALGGLLSLKLEVEWGKMGPNDDRRIHSQGTGKFETGLLFYFGTKESAGTRESMESSDYDGLGAYVYDRGVLEGTWEQQTRVTQPNGDRVDDRTWSKPTASGTWELVVGGPYMWPIERGSFRGADSATECDPLQDPPETEPASWAACMFGPINVDEDPEWSKALARLDASQVDSERESK